MHLVLLKITGNKSLLAEHMLGHNTWLQQGFDAGVFLASGSLQDQPGGGILVHGLSDTQVHDLVNQDPFVTHSLVTPEIIGLSISKADSRLAFLQEPIP